MRPNGAGRRWNKDWCCAGNAEKLARSWLERGLLRGFGQLCAQDRNHLEWDWLELKSSRKGAGLGRSLVAGYWAPCGDRSVVQGQAPFENGGFGPHFRRKWARLHLAALRTKKQGIISLMQIFLTDLARALSLTPCATIFFDGLPTAY